jgi:hypothetical protein
MRLEESWGQIVAGEVTRREMLGSASGAKH